MGLTTMKKTYIQPQTQIVKVNICHMLAASTVNVSSENYEEGNMTDLVKENRGYNIWDYDWSE